MYKKIYVLRQICHTLLWQRYQIKVSPDLENCLAIMENQMLEHNEAIRVEVVRVCWQFMEAMRCCGDPSYNPSRLILFTCGCR